MSGKERTLSVLIAAVAGGSKLFERRGGSEAAHAVERCRKRMIRGVDGFRGRMVKGRRDELVALFDHADDACQAAIAMQRRVADLPPVSGVQLAIRVAVQHGAVREDGADAVGAAVSTAERLVDLASAGQILSSAETWARLSPSLQSTARRCEPPAEQAASVGGELFAIEWLEAKPTVDQATVDPPAAAPARAGGSRLCIRYSGQVRVLDRNRPRVDMGRDSACEIAIRDRRASRNHACIERRGDHFVLRDLSTNGTFVTVHGESELFLRCEEFILRGSGIIAFAASASSAKADIAEFEHV